MATHQRIILLCCLLFASTAIGDTPPVTNSNFSIGIRPLLLLQANYQQEDLINLHAAYRHGRDEVALELGDLRFSDRGESENFKIIALRWKRFAPGATGGRYFYAFAERDRYDEAYAFGSGEHSRSLSIGMGIGYKKYFGQPSPVRVYMESLLGIGWVRHVEERETPDFFNQNTSSSSSGIRIDFELLGLGISF